MDPRKLKKKSKALALALRHRPEKVGLTLDEGGWASVEDLLQAMRMTHDELETVVRDNDKRRFAFDETGTRIRASQGHSVDVELGLQAQAPPDALYHGTHSGAVEAILVGGLQRMARHAVHLSPDVETATRVGARRGRPVVLRVDARRMHEEDHVFTRSENGVWLVDEVPPEYIERIDG